MNVSKKPEEFDLVIVGGGAAGFFAAITCAEQGRGNPAYASMPARLRILILEKSHRPLGKVLASGGGRCNLTHTCTGPAELVENYPRGKAELRSAFARFNTQDTITWFETHGVALKTEPDGRIFPISNSSQSVVDLLMTAANQVEVMLWTEVSIESIEKIDKSETTKHQESSDLARFRIRFMTGTRHPTEVYPEMITTRCILFATGGDISSMKLVASFGHTILPPVPSLFTFSIADPRLEGLAGLSVANGSLHLDIKENVNQNTPFSSYSTEQNSSFDQKSRKKRGNLQATNFEQQGAVLITHWGLSGPVVLRLSAWGARWLHEHAYQAWVKVNWMFPLRPAKVQEAIKDFRDNKDQNKRGNLKSQKVIAFDPLQHLPQRLWQHLVQAAGIDPDKNWANLSNLAVQRLVDELTSGRFLIRGRGPFNEEFVTCGGVFLDEVNFKTMESKLIPGLFFAGEILDIDGLTGGYNLQNAWTTGWIAGVGVAKASYYRSAL